jgi:hypothetical protein
MGGDGTNTQCVCLHLVIDIRDMDNALRLLGWPNPVSNSETTQFALAQLRLAFKKLSIFQHPSSSSTETVTLPSSDASGPLLPFKVMAKEIDIRFRYHFEGNRPTNNIEKVIFPLTMLMSA